jgi:hypothetical protein
MWQHVAKIKLLCKKNGHSFVPFLTSSEDSPRSIVVRTLYTTQDGNELVSTNNNNLYARRLERLYYSIMKLCYEIKDIKEIFNFI